LSRFEEISRILSENRSFWQLIPFDFLELPWQAENPVLWAWLNGLDREDILTYDVTDERLSDELSPFLPDIKILKSLTGLPAWEGSNTTYAAALNRYVPGRKWEQIKAFADTIPMENNPILEWCAGKGHLGRLLACTYHVSVTSLERNKHLCDDGRKLAEKVHAPMAFQTVDVLTPKAAEYIKPDQHAIALHACGELHLTLLRLASEKKCSAISIAPCCYHLIADQMYQPLSTHGIEKDLGLRRFDLKLPIQEQVTATLRIQRLREIQLHWRLAFDLYQRDLTGTTRYRPVPTVREAMLNTDIKTFFEWAAAKCNIPATGSLDYYAYERRAGERRIVISRIELIRHVFRRPLEIWLVLDRALYLMERNYEITIGEFCPKPITPRNVIIHAERAA
jgi:hypothetical protein